MTIYHQYQGPVPEWEDFIQRAGLSQVSPANISPEELRTQTNSSRVAAAQSTLTKLGLLNKVIWQDYSILTRDFQDIIARVYKRKDAIPSKTLPVYLYFHGGGYLLGNTETEDASCSRLVASYPTPGLIVVSVNYRHTPEFQWPTPFYDAWDSFEWLSNHISELGGDPSQIVIGGVSAGGGLAASVVTREHELKATGEQPLVVRGQVLCSPWILHPSASPFASHDLSSFSQNQNAPNLPWAALQLFSNLLGPAAATDPYFNIALNTSQQIKGMPKASFLIAGQDLLRDEGLYYAEKLKENGVPTKVHIFPGLPHGFRNFADLPSSQRWEELVLQSVQWCLSADIDFVLEVELRTMTDRRN